MSGSEDPAFTSSTASAKISSEDIKNIFRPSITQATVTAAQIERVKKTHKRISRGVNFSFDYNCLIVIASVIAALGLASNSNAAVVASMLLSPIMGPVVGMAYGVSIWDLKLVRRSIRNECCSLLICIIIGMIVGICVMWTDLPNDWPTNEMRTRGEWQNFYVGIPVAFFSGLGVALSIGDDHVSSLVGVAISASLLPPAVNAGLLWMYNAFLLAGVKDESSEIDYNYREMGLVSLLLTLVNILCVWVASTLMFRIKEVLPVKKGDFWYDLKTARRVYQRRAMQEEDLEQGYRDVESDTSKSAG